MALVIILYSEEMKKGRKGEDICMDVLYSIGGRGEREEVAEKY